MIDNKRTLQYQEDSYHFSKILAEWNLSFKKTHPELVISGSPQRCVYRIVVEDDTSHNFILENIPKTQFSHKQRIAQTLSYLSQNNIAEINPYLKNENGFFAKIDSKFWQIQPFIRGIELDRPNYVFDAWRGEKLADFLIRLWKTTEDISENISSPFFSLKDYVVNMIDNMSKYHPIELAQIESVFDYLSSDFLNYDQIPLRFCHGDYHPLNVIWDYDSIRAVIDWEFLGLKIEIYDMANLLGCIGIEDPTCLIKDFAIEFIKKIKQSDFMTKKGVLYLFDCMIALRFAWLSEWLRSNDRDMIQLEIEYMNLLLDNKTEIKKRWNIS